MNILIYQFHYSPLLSVINEDLERLFATEFSMLEKRLPQIYSSHNIFLVDCQKCPNCLKVLAVFLNDATMDIRYSDRFQSHIALIVELKNNHIAVFSVD